jgi:transposase
VDLRQRVVDLVHQGKHRKEEIAARFLVSVSSINRWLKRPQLAANKPGPVNAHALNREALINLVALEPDAYLDEPAEKLNSKRSTVAYNLAVLKISRKKKPRCTKNEKKKTAGNSSRTLKRLILPVLYMWTNVD